MPRSDTIAAISTPAGVGGIAVVRLSGPDALPIALRHLSHSLEPRRATHCRFDDLDDVVAVYMPAGYTGEPTVEIACHGSLYVQQALLDTLVGDTARLAEAGEFTMRAFLNGRLDLSQAEAVADLIDAATPQQHRLATSQLRGGYAQKLKDLRQQMLDLTSLLELELDFSQEDVEFADRSRLRSLVEVLRQEAGRLVSSFHLGNALKQGVPVAIIGAPNAGKSSLLNVLVADDRAIVSPIPGTTRDTIEETLTMGGITFRFVDTAGLRHSDDPIEQLGIQRSRKAIEAAEIVLCVCDINAPADDDIEALLEECRQRDKSALLVCNKADLCDNPLYGNIGKDSGCYRVSALTGQGVEDLKQGLVNLVKNEREHYGDILLTNLRHYEALRQVCKALDETTQGLDDGMPADLLAVDLRDALHHLGTITGEVTTDEILGNIFKRFCI